MHGRYLVKGLGVEFYKAVHKTLGLCKVFALAAPHVVNPDEPAVSQIVVQQVNVFVMNALQARIVENYKRRRGAVEKAAALVEKIKATENLLNSGLADPVWGERLDDTEAPLYPVLAPFPD
jgi:hypothetical protein